MKKAWMTLFLLCSIPTELLAQSPKDAFIKKAKLMEGSYQVVKGSNPACSDGYFSTVANSFEKGIHIGHDVYFGPFTVGPQEEGYCHVQQSFDFKENQLIQKTVISKCPKDQINDAGTTTRLLIFSGQEIIYQIKESKFNCRFKLANKEKK